MQSGDDRFIVLAEPCSLRALESPCVYNKATDELYELSAEAFEFLKLCDGTRKACEAGGDPEFLGYCFREGILVKSKSPRRRFFNAGQAPSPSLRYLELHLTSRCNLRCRHCYLDSVDGRDLDLMGVFKVMDEFDSMQGLRLLISGGEPLLHRGFWYANERFRDYGFRSVLLTNGTVITRESAHRLKVHEAQVSIDGMRAAHDALRGEGTFKMTVQGIEYLNAAGIRVSVATMVTTANRDDFDSIGKLVESLGVTEWNVDAPSLSGRLKANPGLLMEPSESARYMSYGFGGGNHGSQKGYACGTHLCAVGPDGRVAKCGFYLDRPVGRVQEGLRTCWERLEPVPLDRLGCDCEHKGECDGGCRYRAATYTGEYGPDPVRCHEFGCSDRVKGGGLDDYREGGEGLRKVV